MSSSRICAARFRLFDMPADTQAHTVDLLRGWLARRLSAEAFAWLTDRCGRIAADAPDRVFFTAFSAVSRYAGKQSLRLTAADLQTAGAERVAWESWTVEQAGRTLLLLSLRSEDAQAYAAKLQKLFASADLGELIALLQSLPLLPHPQRLIALAAEGARSNMNAVFNAVALRNAYPAEHFDETSWNQLVLKALFIGSPLYLIHGLDDRANPTLARMLVDYAHERWAARRPVSPELWRLVGPFADENMVADLEKVLTDPDPVQQGAAALALSRSSSAAARTLLARRADLQVAIADGRLTWRTLIQDQFTPRAPMI
jgi:hypothetical protein